MTHYGYSAVSDAPSSQHINVRHPEPGGSRSQSRLRTRIHLSPAFQPWECRRIDNTMNRITIVKIELDEPHPGYLAFNFHGWRRLKWSEFQGGDGRTAVSGKFLHNTRLDVRPRWHGAITKAGSAFYFLFAVHLR